MSERAKGQASGQAGNALPMEGAHAHQPRKLSIPIPLFKMAHTRALVGFV